MLPQGEGVLRRGAIAGDRLLVSGTIGDAALGLKLLRAPGLEEEWGLSGDEAAFLVDRYRCPKARSALALPLRQCARAAIDVSDGLIGDTMKLCKASGVSAMIELSRVPLSPAAAKAVTKAPELLSELITAGDDYEIVAAMEASHAGVFEKEAEQHGVTVTAIGEVRDGGGEVEVLDEGGRPLKLGRSSYEHFE
jgi:thiamine-monophosphate kinase